MSPEKTKILQEKYPKIFGLGEDSNEPYGLYGLECGDGWFDLIDILCRNIQHHVDWKTKNLPEDGRDKHVSKDAACKESSPSPSEGRRGVSRTKLRSQSPPVLFRRSPPAKPVVSLAERLKMMRGY